MSRNTKIFLALGIIGTLFWIISSWFASVPVSKLESVLHF